MGTCDLARCPSKGEDARTSHPCERCAGRGKATCVCRRGKNIFLARGKILERCVMSEEKKNAAEEIGTLSSCLIEGDPEQKARERKIKRRALAISIALQCATIVALVLVPLLGRTEKLPLNTITPIPPYPHSAHRPETPPRQSPQTSRQECIVCFNRDLSL